MESHLLSRFKVRRGAGGVVDTNAALVMSTLDGALRPYCLVLQDVGFLCRNDALWPCLRPM